MLAACLGLSGCGVPDWANPVAWYRDATGASQDDPKSNARNTQNLQKGGDEDYPNLASVPPPPTNALSAADAEKLRNSLAADRANAKYVQGNDQYVPAPPKDVPGPPLNAPDAPAPTQAAAPPPPAVQATPVQPPPTPAAAPPASTTRQVAARGTQAPPQESPLTSPTVRSVPQGETPRAAPPPPPGVPVRAQAQPQPAPPVPQQSAALPPPSLPPPPDPAFDPAYAGGGAAQPSNVGVTLGTILFDGNTARLSPEMLAQVREVAALRQQNGGGTIHVTGYSIPQGEQDTMGPQLASFNLALDRARAVAAALTQNGVPLRSVEIGASPPPPGSAGGVVEISLEQ